MDFVTGALGILRPKLLQLLQDEYQLQKGVREQVESLARELDSMLTALCMVAQVPHDKLDPQDQLWASHVREASYDMEDVLDTFLVRVDDGDNQKADADKTLLNRFLEKMGNLFSLSKFKARREIHSTIESITKQVDEVSRLRKRYRVDDRVAKYSTTIRSIDPRFLSFYTKASELVGIDKPRDDLLKELLSECDDDASDTNTKVVSIFGCGGLGKTTLAKVIYNKLTTDMNIHCKAFVPVGQKPDLKKVYRDILLELDQGHYKNNINLLMILDEWQLIDKIQGFLKEKRYLILMDDIWEVSTWEAIRIALNDNNLGSKIITTTRSRDVAHAKQVHFSYELMPLLHENSEILFFGRIFGSKEECPEWFSGLSQRILKKCGGVPLAIITLSSLLADKLDVGYWERLCNTIGSGISSSEDGMSSMGNILSLSYDDLPSHLKTCFLYLSMYPEDWKIDRDELIWMWIAEGFIQPQQYCDDVFELGEIYFNELINRSLIQPVCYRDPSFGIYYCRVHDMILDLIRSLSREQNFATTSEQVISSGTKQIRRLSLNSATTFPKVGTSRLRSLVMFRPSIGSLLSLSSFGVLRVLALVNFYVKDEDIMLNVESLIHLRYLWVQGTDLKVLPDGIGKLHNLQILHMCNGLSIPSRQPIFWLKQLVYIRGIECCPMPGKLLRNLASLQVLSSLKLDENSAGAVHELGRLTKLTELRINVKMQMDQSIYDALISSLGKLRRLQELHVDDWFCKPRINRFINWENWMPLPHKLQKLRIFGDILLQTLPKWINHISLPHLTLLYLTKVNSIRHEDIQIMGELPSLLELWLCASDSNLTGPLQKFVHRTRAFPRATSCKFHCVVIVPSMFPRGAMSKVEEFMFYIRASDFFSDDGLDFSDLSLEHFPSLQKAAFRILGNNSEEVNKVKEAVNHAVNVHPDHPSIELFVEDPSQQ